MAVGIAPMAIFYIFACSNLQPKAKGRDKVGVIGEMGAIGFQGRIGFIIVLMAPITLTSASADHLPRWGARFFRRNILLFGFLFLYLSFVCALCARGRKSPTPMKIINK